MNRTEMSDDEKAMLVALHNGNDPREEDPLAKGLETRGLAARTNDGSAWQLTPAGSDYLSELTPG